MSLIFAGAVLPGGFSGVETPGQGAQLLLEFTADQRAQAEAAQQILVQRRVKPVSAEVRARVARAHVLDQGNCQPGGCVHRP